MGNLNYKKENLKASYDAIIVGSGLGSLVTAYFLAKKGKSVCVLEKHYVGGGFTHTFSRKGYEWDVGIHYIGEVNKEYSILRKLFDLVTDKKLKWAAMHDIYDRGVFGEESYDFPTGIQAFKEEFFKKFPEEKEAIEKYIQAVMTCTKASRKYFASKVMPSFLSFVIKNDLKTFHSFSDQKTIDVLRQFTSNEKLIGALTTQYGDYGLPPSESSFAMHAMVAKHYFGGAAYPVGGAAQIFNTIQPVLEKMGVDLFLRAEVDQLSFDGSKLSGVILKNGDPVSSPIVISGTGVHHSFRKLVPESHSKSSKLKKSISHLEASYSHICLYVGLKKTARELGLRQTNLWVYPSYDHDQNIKNYKENPDADFPMVYISFPSTKDPDFEKNHPGRATIEVITLAPYGAFEKWKDTQWMKRGDDYKDFKEKLSQRLLEALYNQIPSLRGQVDYYELSTPLSTEHFAGYAQGEIYGVEHTPERFRNEALKPKTLIPHFYLTGQDIVTCGIGGALFSGVLTASAVLKKNLMKEITG